MKKWMVLILVLFVAALLLAIGCGDDDEDTTGTPTGDGEEAGEGGEEPDGDGDAAAGGTAGIGEECTEDTDCAFGGICLDSEVLAPFVDEGDPPEVPGGYCTIIPCEVDEALDEACKPNGGVCISVGWIDPENAALAGINICLKECASDADCRDENYLCLDPDMMVAGGYITQEQADQYLAGKKGCLPKDLLSLLTEGGCATDADCPVPQSCNAETGACAVACVEGCSNESCPEATEFCTERYGDCMAVPCETDDDCLGLGACDANEDSNKVFECGEEGFCLRAAE